MGVGESAAGEIGQQTLRGALAGGGAGDIGAQDGLAPIFGVRRKASDVVGRRRSVVHIDRQPGISGVDGVDLPAAERRIERRGSYCPSICVRVRTEDRIPRW